MKRPSSPLAWAVSLLPLVVASACSSTRHDVKIGSDCADGFCERQPTFTSPADAGTEAEPALAEPVPMCPVTTCSFPYATCTSSEFPCDVNLLTDDENCGGCGISCNRGISLPSARFSCVDGECVFRCINSNGSFPANCDNDISNGCEILLGNNVHNCGACGHECTGIAPECKDAQCSDRCDGKPDRCPECTDVQVDPNNCGACGNKCDNSKRPAPPPHTEYTCIDGECGRLKCTKNWGDCNNDNYAVGSDGCETSLSTEGNCGACGNVCDPDDVCGRPDSFSTYRCYCSDPSKTYCGGIIDVVGPCRTLDTDVKHCGACYRECPGQGRAHFEVACTAGVCGGKCIEHYEDCDKLEENGCEVNTLVDNRNCGTCGNACAPNQVCSEGKCLVAPCEQGTTK